MIEDVKQIQNDIQYKGYELVNQVINMDKEERDKLMNDY